MSNFSSRPGNNTRRITERDPPKQVSHEVKPDPALTQALVGAYRISCPASGPEPLSGTRSEVEQRSLVAVPQDRPRVELVDHELYVHGLVLTGAVAELAADAGAAATPAIAERVVIDAADVGATLMRHGQTQALVNSVRTEIDRLLSMTGSANEQLPTCERWGDRIRAGQEWHLDHSDDRHTRVGPVASRHGQDVGGPRRTSGTARWGSGEPLPQRGCGVS